MEYYVLKQNTDYTNSPQIIAWMDIINPNFVTMEKEHLIPKRELLLIKPHKNILEIDIITMGLKLFSKRAFEVLKQYNPQLRSKEIVLLEQTHGASFIYYLPIFEIIEANIEKNITLKTESYTLKIMPKNDSAFVSNTYKGKELIVRQDFLESLRIRNLRGFQTKKIQL